jgi:O-antigen ligase
VTIRDPEFLSRAAFVCAFGAASATLASIAASQILLGASVAALWLARAKWRWTPAAWPLAGLIGWTLATLPFADAPAAGLPQIRKFYVFLALPVLATTIRPGAAALRLVWTWTAVGSAAALWSFWQYADKWLAAEESGRDFYLAYVADRITGFMSHWMTFSGLQMIVLIYAAARLLFGKPGRRERWLLAGACAVVGLSIVLGLTRGVWIAVAAASLYLLWFWKRWAAALLPVAAGAIVAFGPAGVQERALSFVKPRGQADSNQHRIVTWRTGVAMIEARPLLGLGPERVGARFQEFVPPDIPRPLPGGWYGHLHNIYLQFAAERGLPALALLLWWLGGALWLWTGALRRSPRNWLLHGSVAALIGTMVTGLFEHNLGDSEVLFLTLAVFALGYLAREEVLQGEPAG